MTDPTSPDAPEGDSRAAHARLATQAGRTASAGLAQARTALGDLLALVGEQADEIAHLAEDLHSERTRRAAGEKAAVAETRRLLDEHDRAAKNAARLSTTLTDERADASARDREQTSAVNRAQYERDAARTEASELRAQIERLRSAPTRPARDDAPRGETLPPSTGLRARPPAAVEAVAKPTAGPVVPTGDSVAALFRAWCVAASPVVSKVAFFANEIQSALPGASVAAVYRDANSQAQPVVFRASGGSSPVEHWLIVADGRHWLLPQPLGGAQFRELAPCFEGTAAPTSLAHVRPADVRAVGDQFELTRAGEVA